MFLKGPKEGLFEIARVHPREFLRGFFDSDGTVIFSKKSKVRYVSASNYDTEVLRLCQDLLGGLKIHSKIYLHRRKGTPVNIRGEIYHYSNDLYEIRIHRRDSVLKYFQDIGFSISRKQAKLENGLRELEWL